MGGFLVVESAVVGLGARRGLCRFRFFVHELDGKAVQLFQFDHEPGLDDYHRQGRGWVDP